MKRLLLVNPNTSPAVTGTLAAAARGLLADRAELMAITAAFGFPVIASRVSYAVAAHAALDAVARAAGEGQGAFDAIILGCFGDPGLEALRELGLPVAGLAEAAVKLAMRRRSRFAILTMGQPWVPMLEERVALVRGSPMLAGVFALDGTGLDALADPDRTLDRLTALIGKAEAAGAETIIPGGATLAGLVRRLDHPRVIDSLAAALDEALALPPRAPRPVLPTPAGLSPALAAYLAGGPLSG